MVYLRRDGANAPRKASHARAPEHGAVRARTASTPAPTGPARRLPAPVGPAGEQTRIKPAGTQTPGQPGWDPDPGQPGWDPDASEPGWSADGGYAGWDAGADHPSWPAADASPGRAGHGADYPSWPANAVDASWPYPGADHPSWPAGAASPDWPQPGTDYSGWPAGASGTGSAPAHGGADWPQQEPPGGLHHDERGQTAAPRTVARQAPGRATTGVGYQIRPPMGAHAKGRRWSAQLARTNATAPQTYYELAFGDGR